MTLPPPDAETTAILILGWITVLCALFAALGWLAEVLAKHFPDSDY